jgi:cytoskeletal protein RodZ
LFPPKGFLLLTVDTETLEVTFIVLIVVAVLTLITITRGGTIKGDEKSSGMSKASNSRNSKSRKDAAETYSPSQDISQMEVDDQSPKHQGTATSTQKDTSDEADPQIETGKIAI